MTNEHSEVGGSAAHRFLRCAASVRMSRGLPNIDTEFSKRGHEAHHAAAFALSFGCEPVHEDAWAIKEYIAEVERVRASYAPHEVVEYIEHWYHRPEIDERQKGTIDYALVCPALSRGTIIDYKNGEGVREVAENNEQVLDYATDMVLRHPDIRLWDLGIAQPRGGGITWWTVSREYILEWLETTLKPGLAATLDPNAPFVPGEKQCKFCPARTICPALKKQEVAVMEPASVSALTDAELNQLGTMVETVKMRCRAVMGELSRRAADCPENFPDFKWVRSSKTHRVWGPGAEEYVAQIGLHGAYTEPELKSPAQIAKLGATGRQMVAKYAVKPEGKLELVPVTHDGARVALSSMQEKYADVLEHLAGE